MVTEFDDGCAWHHFVALSHERVASPAHAVREFTEGFVRRAVSVAQRPLAWFYSATAPAAASASTSVCR